MAVAAQEGHQAGHILVVLLWDVAVVNVQQDVQAGAAGRVRLKVAKLGNEAGRPALSACRRLLLPLGQPPLQRLIHAQLLLGGADLMQHLGVKGVVHGGGKGVVAIQRLIHGLGRLTHHHPHVKDVRVDACHGVHAVALAGARLAHVRHQRRRQQPPIPHPELDAQVACHALVNHANGHVQAHRRLVDCRPLPSLCCTPTAPSRCPSAAPPRLIGHSGAGHRGGALLPQRLRRTIQACL